MHPLVEAAAAGELPPWADVSSKRAEHIERVRLLLAEWADAAGISEDDAKRWCAAGTLHDALHDAKPKELRPTVAAQFADLPGKMLHGPACVARLRAEGVNDEELLHAIEYHTIGHPDLTALGRALYAADFLEPGRPHDAAIRSALRSRMPAEMDTVVPAILKSRLLDQVSSGRSIREETLAFWNSIPDDRRA